MKNVKWEGRNGVQRRIGRMVIGGIERKERGVQEEERKIDRQKKRSAEG